MDVRVLLRIHHATTIYNYVGSPLGLFQRQSLDTRQFLSFEQFQTRTTSSTDVANLQ